MLQMDAEEGEVLEDGEIEDEPVETQSTAGRLIIQDIG